MSSETTASQQNEINIKQTEDMIEIDLLDLFYFLLNKIHYIILSFLAGAVIFNAAVYFFVQPTYQSTAKLYIVSASNDSVVNLTDLNIGSSLTSDYEELIMSYPVLDQVIDRLDLSVNYGTLAKMISLSNPKDTRILNITVTHTSPAMACDIANTLADVAVKYLPDTMSTREPNVAQIARVANKKYGPSYLKYTAIGALLGAFLYCAIAIVGYLMDDTIHTADDMEKYFGIVPLTVLPENSQFRQEDSAHKDKDTEGGKQKK